MTNQTLWDPNLLDWRQWGGWGWCVGGTLAQLPEDNVPLAQWFDSQVKSVDRKHALSNRNIG